MPFLCAFPQRNALLSGIHALLEQSDDMCADLRAAAKCTSFRSQQAS